MTERLRGRKRKERNERLAADNPLCVLCAEKGRVSAVAEWDHIVPLWKGGADDESNLQGLCSDCHKDKTREDMDVRPRIGSDGWPV